jgi:hypothetical protein
MRAIVGGRLTQVNNNPRLQTPFRRAGKKEHSMSEIRPTAVSKWCIRHLSLAYLKSRISVVCLTWLIIRVAPMKNVNGENGLAREERLQIMLSPEELKAVDNFRFHHRMPSRAAAVRELLRFGLSAVGAVAENVGIKSGDYGVLKAARSSRSIR